jgi:hypothetical protein
MKSHLFTTEPMSEEFSEDIEKLSEMEPEAIERLAEYVLESHEAPTRAETRQVSEVVAEALGVPLVTVGPALSVARFFLRMLSPKGEAESDDPETLVDDLKEMYDLPDDKGEAVRSLLERLKVLAQDRVRLTQLRREHEEIALPTLAAVSVSAELRAVFDERYEYDKDVCEFSPKLLGTVPIGILRLRLMGGSTKDVFVQLSRKTLQILIDYLVALQKQIDLMEEKTHVEGEPTT